MANNPVYKLSPNDDLGMLMMRMLFREGNTEAYVTEVAEQMQQWAGEDGERKQQLAAYCRSVLDGKYEYIPAARLALRKLAGR